MGNNFKVPSSLSARDAEVISDQIQRGLGEGREFFKFTLQTDFLPTIGWLERFRGLLAPIVEQKKTIEMLADCEQRKSLRRSGFHLIGDIND